MSQQEPLQQLDLYLHYRHCHLLQETLPEWMLLQWEDQIHYDLMMCPTQCWRNSSFSYKISFFFAFLFFCVVTRTVGSNGPLPSIVQATESISESGIRLREAVHDSEVGERDDKVYDDDNDDDDNDDVFTIRNNQPTWAG